ncbi:MAG: dimethyl sulfoxide reductase anchor subunit [Nitrospirae bacterium]|nr:dimethyl sulfoxide reductase anchor subunit [Nitrospirota bacterium]
MSLVLLLSLAGVGQGIFIFLVLLDLFFQLAGGMPLSIAYTSGGIVLISTGIGMAASTLHLGNPQRSWRAVFRWQSSWLSREALFMGAFMGVAAMYFASFFLDIHGVLRLGIGFIGIAAAMGLYVSSAMLYAKIRFIKEWANPFAVADFILLGLLSGGSVVFSILQYHGFIFLLFNYLLLLIGITSLTLKIFTYRFNANIYMPVGARHALGINNPDIKLISTGSSYEYYNTKEFFYPVKKEDVNMQRLSVILLLAVSVILWGLINAVPQGENNFILSISATILIISGRIIERRLFFIQGNHIQNLYYERFRNKNTVNPLLSRAKK